MIHVSEVRHANIPSSDSDSGPFHVIIPTSARNFTMFYPVTSLTTAVIWAPPCSHEAVPISKFTISVLSSSLALSKGVKPGKHS